jgi:hypothetical protein
MVINGGSRGKGKELAGELLFTGADEHAELIELRWVASETLSGAIAELEAVGSCRSIRPLYHAWIKTAPGEDLTREQQTHAIATLERRLGLSKTARAVVERHSGGQCQLHVVWCRVAIETMTLVHDSWNYPAHEEVARQLEREFGHACPPRSERRW